MQPKGIVRKFNDNGRVAIPIEWRRDYGLEDAGVMVEVLATKQGVLVRKYEPACVFCGSMEQLENIEDKKVCRKCIDKLKK